jgi:hypothetical protein
VFDVGDVGHADAVGNGGVGVGGDEVAWVAEDGRAGEDVSGVGEKSAAFHGLVLLVLLRGGAVG